VGPTIAATLVARPLTQWKVRPQPQVTLNSQPTFRGQAHTRRGSEDLFLLQRAFWPVRMGAVPDEATGGNDRAAASGPSGRHAELPASTDSKVAHG